MIHVSKNQRERDITKVSSVGIVSNAALGGIKIAVGVMTHSVAIISDAVNNLTDTASSIITIIGTHLSTRHPDKKHPFGYGRIEYLTSLVIGLIVAFTGVELCRDSIITIIHGDHVQYNAMAAIVLAATVVVKIFLSIYTYRAGVRLDSDALKASGLDARSDSVTTAAALIAVLLYLWKKIDIDAWVGAFISLYIMRTGLIILRDTVSKLVGEAPSKDLTDKIRAAVNAVPIVKGAYDLILNTYGPDYHVGCINVEVDYNLTAEEIFSALHPAQMRIYRDLRTHLVFGIYAVDPSSPDTQKVASAAADFCKANPHCLSYHGIFVDNRTKEIFCDLVVDYGFDVDDIVSRFSQALSQAMPGYTPIVNSDAPDE